MEGYSWSSKYGFDHMASGSVFLDTVKLGSLTVTNQAVEAAANLSSYFTKDSAYDGMIGLAFVSRSFTLPI